MSCSLVVLSYKVEELFEELYRRLYHPKASFRKIIIVPSTTVQDDLIKRLMQSSSQVAMGFKIITLQQAVIYLLKLHDPKLNTSCVLPSHGKLLLLIQEAIEKLLGCDDFKHETKTELIFLRNYVTDQNKEINQCKLLHLSDALAYEFSKIRLCSSFVLNQFLKDRSWQSVVFKEVFSPYEDFSKILEAESFVSSSIALDIHLYLLPHLPEAFQELFSKMSKIHAVVDYIWTPTNMFVGDMLTDKKNLIYERRSLERGVKIEELIELHAYLNDRHPIIANFCEVLKSRLQPLETFAYPQLELFEKHQTTKELKCLNRLQQSFLELDLSDLKVDEMDDSLQLHAAPSLLREVQVVKQVLMDLMHRHHFRSSDCLILVTDLSQYEPFIRHVFEDEEHPLPIKIHPIAIMSQSPFLQSLERMLILHHKGFQLADLLELLYFEPIKSKWELSDEDLEKLQIWCEKAEIQGDFDTREDPRLQHSWDKGLRRLIMGTAIFDEPASQPIGGYYPLDIVEGSQLQLLEKLIKIVHFVKATLDSFESSQHAMSRWVERLFEFVNFMFEARSDGGYAYLFKQLKEYIELEDKLSLHPFCYRAFLKVLEGIIHASSGSYDEHVTGSMTITELKEEHVLAFPIIVMMGLDEARHPKRRQDFPICKFDKHFARDTLKQEAIERDAFLRVLGMAKSYVVMSYTHLSSDDGKLLMPSSFVLELNNFVKQHMHVDGISSVQHPLYSFHEKYFSDEKLRSFSQTDFQIALKCQQNIPKLHRFLKTFYSDKLIENSTILPGLHKIKLNDMRELLKHPIRHYFKKVIGMPFSLELDDDEKQLRLQTWQIRKLAKEALREGADVVTRKAQYLGKLPDGIFCDRAIMSIQEDAHQLQKFLDAYNLKSHDLITIQLTADCFKPEWVNEKLLICPALRYSLSHDTEVSIEGTIEDVSKYGMMLFTKRDIKNLSENYFSYLVYAKLDLGNFGLKNALVFLEGQKEFSIDQAVVDNHLTAFLKYSFKVRDIPSPLLPSWIPHFFSDTCESLAGKLVKDFSSYEQHDATLTWCKDHFGEFSAELLHDQWSKVAQELFSFLNTQEAETTI